MLVVILQRSGEIIYPGGHMLITIKSILVDIKENAAALLHNIRDGRRRKQKTQLQHVLMSGSVRRIK